MADQILMFRSGLKRNVPANAPPPAARVATEADNDISEQDQSADDRSDDSRSEGTIKLIGIQRQKQMHRGTLQWIFNALAGLRLSDVVTRPHSKIQFGLWVAVLSLTCVSALAVFLGSLNSPLPAIETVDNEGFEETIDATQPPHPFSPADSIAITPGPMTAGPVSEPGFSGPGLSGPGLSETGSESAMGLAERLEAGRTFTQTSGDSLHSDSRGAWLEGTIQDDVVEPAPFGR